MKKVNSYKMESLIARFTLFLFFTEFLFSGKVLGQTSGYSQDFNNAVIAIYKSDKDTLKPHGTGFLIDGSTSGNGRST
jgi:hypothetical protein